MRKIKIAILSVVLSGLLLCGIGAGVMFYEFSTLDYIGEYSYKSDHVKTSKTVLEIAEFPNKKVNITPTARRNNIEFKLIEDDNVKENTLYIETVYDGDLNEPFYFLDLYSKGSDEVLLEVNYYTNDDVVSFFKMKDVILENLKNRKIAQYRYDDSIEATVRINPKTMEKVILK